MAGISNENKTSFPVPLLDFLSGQHGLSGVGGVMWRFILEKHHNIIIIYLKVGKSFTVSDFRFHNPDLVSIVKATGIV